MTTPAPGPTFLERHRAGEELDVDDFVEAWHEGAGEGLELHEFLGMTWDEYGHWARTAELPAAPSATTPAAPSNQGG
jgi:hypothetical protein